MCLLQVAGVSVQCATCNSVRSRQHRFISFISFVVVLGFSDPHFEKKLTLPLPKIKFSSKMKDGKLEMQAPRAHAKLVQLPLVMNSICVLYYVFDIHYVCCT